MSGYEVEHNIKPSEPSKYQRRPDLSTFHAALDLVDTSGSRQPTNSNVQPFPDDVTAAFRLLANAYEMMRDRSGAEAQGRPNDLLGELIEELMRNADDPPEEVRGVPDSFLDELERVPKEDLKAGDSCPICSNPFLEDEYPLVVELPCHKDHRFDLDCIRPWLKLNSTCPLDRKELVKKKAPPPPPDEEDGEYDDFYA